MVLVMKKYIDDNLYTYDTADADRLLPQRRADSHKGTYGTVCVIGGAVNMAGALTFAGEAAYRTGCGLVRVVTDEKNREILQIRLPEAVLLTYDAADTSSVEQTLSRALAGADVCVLGPGLSQSDTAMYIVKWVLSHFEGELVADADALNILSKQPALWGQVAASGMIITPHLKEMSRLTGLPVAEIKENKHKIAKVFAKEHRCVVILKDAKSVVSDGGEEGYINTCGDHGMATGGAGDVLAGICGGLLAQRCAPFEAAKLACLLHGMAGSYAAKELGSYSMLARDIARAISGILEESSLSADYNRIYAAIDMDALKFNIRQMQALKPGMKTLVVIKADAYGHGAVEIAKRIDTMSDYYGVATIDEAVELRNAGITKPILIIGYTAEEDFERLLDHHITQAVYDAEACKKLSELAVEKGVRAKVHIKVDTGMSRIGFQTDEEGIIAAASLKELPGLEIEGIFTHYAKADEMDKQYAFKQKERFLSFIRALEERGISFSLKHIDNSAGTMELPDGEFDMFRMGIVTYGLYPSDEVNRDVEIRPVMSLKCHVAHVKTVPAGRGVSYGWTYVTCRDTRIATITCGYADGYPRALSNTGRVIIHGKYAPIIGRVCMDQIMVDVSEIPETAVGDEVIMIGRDGDCEVSVEEVAAPAASFNYELVCNIARRVPRVYYEGGKRVACVNYLT